VDDPSPARAEHSRDLLGQIETLILEQVLDHVPGDDDGSRRRRKAYLADSALLETAPSRER
jgi:hypothetical protein